MPTLNDVIRDGFDQSTMDPDDPRYVDVRCSQCAAVVINGTPAHEAGCPNSLRLKYAAPDEEEE